MPDLHQGAHWKVLIPVREQVLAQVLLGLRNCFSSHFTLQVSKPRLREER